MITIFFEFSNEYILVTIKGNKVTFANTQFGAKETGIEGLRLSREGVIKEFPDLEGKDNWKDEAIKRFKKKINSFSTESQIAEYLITDLKNHGYFPKKIQREGFRPKPIK